MSFTGRKLVAIAVPLSNKNFFTEDEKISLRHLEKFLFSYDRYFLIPEGLEIHCDGFGKKRFGSTYFGTMEAHRKLIFSQEFYEAFKEYEFVLLYHLDALVFSSQLEEWCKRGFDYVAAPWIKHPDAPYHGNPEYEGKVGNGGFSLRKVESLLAVLNSRKLWRNPFRRTIHELRFGTARERYSSLLKFFRYWDSKHNGVRQELANYYQNEDHFWPNRASYYLPQFKISPMDIALKFSFECVPRYCYELNERKLPFGCHAWNRYDPEFWRPFIIS